MRANHSSGPKSCRAWVNARGALTLSTKSAGSRRRQFSNPRRRATGSSLHSTPRCGTAVGSSLSDVRPRLLRGTARLSSVNSSSPRFQCGPPRPILHHHRSIRFVLKTWWALDRQGRTRVLASYTVCSLHSRSSAGRLAVKIHSTSAVLRTRQDSGSWGTAARRLRNLWSPCRRRLRPLEESQAA